MFIVKTFISLALGWYISSFSPLSASERQPSQCPNDEIVSQSITDVIGEKHINAIAVVNFVPRGSTAVIWRANTRSWELANAGSVLVAGDAVCLLGGTRPAIVRIATDKGSQLVRLTSGPTPLMLGGEQTEQLSTKAAEWLATVDWPSPNEVAAIERSANSSSRARTGATRGMSIGSTPRAVYLESTGGLADSKAQKITIGLSEYLWGWCGSDQVAKTIGGATTSGNIKPFEPFPFSAIKGAGEVGIFEGGNKKRRYTLEWIDENALPLPIWVIKSQDPLLKALWLAEHESGDFQLLGHSMLNALVQSRPVALHYLAHRSECGSGYIFRPGLNIVPD